MPRLHKKHLKALKRKRRVDGKREYERTMLKNSIVIGRGRGNRMVLRKPGKEKEAPVPKVKKPLPTYRAVKLTARLDKLDLRIKEADANDPKLPSLKLRRDELIAKLKTKAIIP